MNMTLISNEIETYRIWYTTGYLDPYGDKTQAVIECYDNNGDTIGAIRFYKDDGIIPANVLIWTDVPLLRYPLSRFNDIITILRYEKPLHIRLNTNTNAGLICTSQKEPIHSGI